MGDTKSKLLDATTAVLREEGIAGLSARAVAGRAEVNQALVFYHFGTMTDLVDLAVRREVDASVERYRAAFDSVTQLSDLVRVGEQLHAQELAAGNVAMMGQLMAGAQHDNGMAAAARYAMSVWVTEVERTLERLLHGSVAREFVDVSGLARAVSAGFIGLELYDSVDSDGKARALTTMGDLAALVDTLNDLGPVATRALRTSLRARRRRAGATD